VASVDWSPEVARRVEDRDHDGVPDGEDACPDEPGPRTDDPRTSGCPPPPTDLDGDAILDDVDACPSVPGVADADPKKNGCPPDRDGDHVPDAVDACPDVPGLASPDPRMNGCPPDRDGDRVPDDADACPDAPGPVSADPAKNGCPLPAPPALAVVNGGLIEIAEPVKFRFGSAALDPASDAVLEAVRSVLSEHPEIRRVRVEGHTDDVGGSAYNLALSDKRARSVVAWLVAHGVARARLTSEGLGARRPLAPNTTEAGRRQNRRVELHIEARN
jgi:outer membrane protein OmpA-like peptidoglycan-associated protein